MVARGMWRRSLCLAVVLGTLLVGEATHAATITIGTRSPGNLGDNCIPFGCAGRFGIDRYQQLYVGSAFPGPIQIDAITFLTRPLHLAL